MVYQMFFFLHIGLTNKKQNKEQTTKLSKDKNLHKIKIRIKDDILSTLGSTNNIEFGNIKHLNTSISSKFKGEEHDKVFDTILQELSAIQQNVPRKVAILGTRHFSYLHQQIVELLTYASVLVGNHIFTSGGTGSGTNAAVIRGALRAGKPELLTVVLPQSIEKQPPDVCDLLKKVQNVVETKKNDHLPLDMASRLCNSDILSRCEHLISFAFHDSVVVLEAAREAKMLNKLVTLLYLD
nr:CMESO_444 [Cryptomonas sp.]